MAKIHSAPHQNKSVFVYNYKSIKQKKYTTVKRIHNVN